MCQVGIAAHKTETDDSGQVCPTFCLDSDLNGVIFVQHAVVFTIKPVRDKCVILQFCLKAENVL